MSRREKQICKHLIQIKYNQGPYANLAQIASLKGNNASVVPLTKEQGLAKYCRQREQIWWFEKGVPCSWEAEEMGRRPITEGTVSC